MYYLTTIFTNLVNIDTVTSLLFSEVFCIWPNLSLKTGLLRSLFSNIQSLTPTSQEQKKIVTWHSRHFGQNFSMIDHLSFGYSAAFTTVCLGAGFLLFIFPQTCCISWIWGFIFFIYIIKFSAILLEHGLCRKKVSCFNGKLHPL